MKCNFCNMAKTTSWSVCGRFCFSFSFQLRKRTKYTSLSLLVLELYFQLKLESLPHVVLYISGQSSHIEDGKAGGGAGAPEEPSGCKGRADRWLGAEPAVHQEPSHHQDLHRLGIQDQFGGKKRSGVFSMFSISLIFDLYRLSSSSSWGTWREAPSLWGGVALQHAESEDPGGWTALRAGGAGRHRGTATGAAGRPAEDPDRLWPTASPGGQTGFEAEVRRSPRVEKSLCARHKQKIASASLLLWTSMENYANVDALL